MMKGNFSWVSGYRCSAVRAEALALWCGLQMCSTHHHLRVMEETDCKLIFDMISGDNFPAHVDFFLFEDCRRMMAKAEWEVLIKHIGRSANEVADWLANKGVNSDIQFEEISMHPIELSQIVLKDLALSALVSVV